jgi:hypothetical protein
MTSLVRERQRGPSLESGVSIAGLVLAAAFGIGVAQGGARRGVIVALAGGLAVLPILRSMMVKRVSQSLLAVEIPVLLLLLSTLVLRIRSTEQLSVDPLDPAGQFRVAMMLAALGLGGIALISQSRAHVGAKLISPPLRMYAFYVAIVFLGAPLSVNPSLTLYRGVELVAALVVVVGARRSVGAEATKRIGAVLYWFAVVLLVTVWIGVVLFPDLALTTFRNLDVLWTFQVSGVLPVLSSNTVGALGVIVAVWSAARVISRQATPMSGYALAVFGTVTLVAAQYRTGYVALALAVGVFVLIQRRWGLATLLAGIAVGAVLSFPSLLTSAEPYVLRGQTIEQASTLSSRLDWWKAAIPVWQESPIIGRGLLTATRFEVLEPLGLGSTSSIHSTWVEALVGTGIVGLTLLAVTLAMMFKRAIREATRRRGWKVPLALLLVIFVRSLTGIAFESLGYFCLVFLWLASSTDEWATMVASNGEG